MMLSEPRAQRPAFIKSHATAERVHHNPGKGCAKHRGNQSQAKHGYPGHTHNRDRGACSSLPLSLSSSSQRGANLHHLSEMPFLLQDGCSGCELQISVTRSVSPVCPPPGSPQQRPRLLAQDRACTWWFEDITQLFFRNRSLKIVTFQIAHY